MIIELLIDLFMSPLVLLANQLPAYSFYEMIIVSPQSSQNVYEPGGSTLLPNQNALFYALDWALGMNHFLPVVDFFTMLLVYVVIFGWYKVWDNIVFCLNLLRGAGA